MISDGSNFIASKWLSLQETCCLLNLAEKTVKNKCRNGEFIYKVTQCKKKFHYYIKLDSLSQIR